MPSGLGDFIGTILKVKALQQQQQQIDETQRADTVQGLNVFMSLARQTANPATLAALADRFSQLGLAPRDALMNTLQNVTPTQEAIHAATTQAGLNVVAGGTTGKGAGADKLARQTAEATLTGQNAGQLAASEYNAGLFGNAPTSGPLYDATAAALAARQAGGSVADVIFGNEVLGFTPAEKGRTARAQAGLVLNEPQAVQAAAQLSAQKIDWAKVNELIRNNRADEALKEMGLGIEYAVGMNRGAGAQSEGLTSLLSTKASVINEINKTKGTPTPGLVLSYIGALNSINQRLEALGYPTEGQIPYNPNYLTDPGLWDRLKGLVRNPAPINVQPSRTIPSPTQPPRKPQDQKR